MKKRFILPGILLLICLSVTGCSWSLYGLLLNDEEKDMIGLWRGESWDSETDISYYDFRKNGRVYVTDWTWDLQTTNNFLVPNYFSYSVNDGILKLDQFFGILKFEFVMVDESTTDIDAYNLQVLSEMSDYDQLDDHNSIYIEKIDDYSDEARAVREYFEEYDYE